VLQKAINQALDVLQVFQKKIFLVHVYKPVALGTLDLVSDIRADMGASSC